MKMWWRSAFALLLVVGCATSSVADEVDDYVRIQMQTLRIPGLALAVVRDGTVVKQQAYGMANVELEVPADTETVFQIASITKIFVSAAILSLVEEGTLSLNDSVTKYLPDLAASWAPVTIRQCLAHTSGLPNIRDGAGFIADNRNEVLLKLAAMPIEAPGERAVYNQTGYMLLGMIIEEVSGLGFKDFVDRQLLRPVGLSSTSFGDNREVVVGRSTMYTIFEPSLDRASSLRRESDLDDQYGGNVVSPDAIYRAYAYIFPSFHAGAGMNSTIEDMARWELALASGSVLDPATLEQASAPFELNNGESGEYGLGWIAGAHNGHRMMEMGGGLATRFLRFPDDDLSVIVLTNLQGAEQGALARGVASFYLADLESER